MFVFVRVFAFIETIDFSVISDVDSVFLDVDSICLKPEVLNDLPVHAALVPGFSFHGSCWPNQPCKVLTEIIRLTGKLLNLFKSHVP